VRLEREMCCDDLAVAGTGRRAGYALALEQVARLQVGGNLSLATAFTGARKMNLLARIQNVLIGRHPAGHGQSWLLALAGVAVPLLAIGLTSNLLTATATAQEEGRRKDKRETRTVDEERERPSAEE